MSDVVTILFTDLVGSTALFASLGEERADALRREHFGLLRAAIGSHAGAEVKTIGDSVMAAFASPARAVGCAVEIERRVDARNRLRDPALRVRVGINAGEATLEDGDYFGMPVVVARRLCDRAEGGQILVSDVVRALAGARGAFVFKDLGPIPLKGIDDPVPACEVVWEPLEDAVPLPPAIASDRTTLLGRDAERAALRAALERATAGSRSLVLLSGEPGIGKTSLAFDLAREAHAAGVTVLYGRCEEDAAVPYRPFAEILAHLGRHRPGAIEGVDPALAGPGAEPAIARADPESDRFRAFEQVRLALEGGGDGPGSLVVLDDLHWADKPTLLLLRHVAQADGEARMLLVGTYRDVELDRRHPLAEMLGALRPGAERIPLRGLSEAEVLSYLERRAGHEMDERGRGLARALHRETEGNPFFLREILRHLVESGALFERDGRWTSDRTIEDAGLPEGVREVIGRRLSRLSDECAEVLSIASVVGRDFDLAVLARVADRNEDRLADLLDEAVRARGVIEEAPGALDRFTFAHALVRETLYEEMSTTRRLRLHRRIGEAIEALYAADIGPRLGELAHHFDEAAAAGGAAKAIDYARRAARRAVEQLAYEEAVTLCARALHTAGEADPLPDPADLCDLLLDLGEAYRHIADTRGTRETCARAADLARAHGWGERLARAALTYGGLWIDVGRTDPTVMALVREAVGALPAEHPLVPLLYSRIAMEMFQGDAQELERTSLRALESARRLGDPVSLAYALIGRRHAVSGPDRLEERLAITAEAIEVAERFGHFDLAMRARAFRIIEHVEGAAIEAVERDYAEFFRLAGERRHPMYLYVSELFRLGIEMREGRVADPDGALAGRLAVVSRWSVEHGRFTAITATASQRIYLRWLRGEPERVDEGAREAIRAFSRAASHYAASGAWAELSSRGPEAARPLWDAISPEDIRRYPRDWSFLALTFFASECALALGGREHAEALSEVVLPFRGRVIATAATALVLTVSTVDAVLGRCSMILGRAEEAVGHLECALATSERMRMLAEGVRVRGEIAAALVARGSPGDEERARRLAEGALADGSAMGLGGVSLAAAARVVEEGRRA